VDSFICKGFYVATIKPNTNELNELSFERMMEMLPADYACSDIEVDLKDISFIVPYGMVLLTILLKTLSQKRIKARLLLPDSSDVMNYLERMSFFAQVEGIVEFDRDIQSLRSNLRNPVDSIIEVTKIKEEKEVMDIVNSLVDKLIDRYGFDRARINRFGNVMSESLQNIPQHSNPDGTPYEGMACVQIYKKFFHFAVGDSGVGICPSLNYNPRIRELNLNEEEALRKVLVEGFSRLDRPGRGGGFSSIRKIVRDMNGFMVVRSGGHTYFLGRKTENFYSVPAICGTQIGIRIPKDVF